MAEDRSYQTRMPLTEWKGYIANSWSRLEEPLRKETEATIDRVEAVLRRHCFSPFVSMREYPPGKRQGRSAHGLWLKLREEMGTSHLFVLVYAGISEGATKELRNARDANVPAILLVRHGTGINELIWSPGLQCLGTIGYDSPEVAEQTLEAFWNEHSEEMDNRASKLQFLRNHNKNVRMGETIRILRERMGLGRATLAKRAGITEEELEAIEQRFVSYNPVFLHVAAIALALDTDISHLCWPPYQWAFHELDVLVTEVALEEDWSVRDVESFRSSGYMETRVASRGVSKDDVRAEMRTWQQHK